MKNPTAEILNHAVELKLEGMSSKQVLAETGLSHSQFELWFWRTVPVADGGLKERVGTVELTGENVIALRDGDGLSWGQISVICGPVPESQIRAEYKKASGKLSQGKRIGHGGRWFLNERELYTDGLQRPGTEITEAEAKELSTRTAALKAATEQKLVHKTSAELKAIAKAEGVSPNGTPAQIVKRIIKARTAK